MVLCCAKTSLSNSESSLGSLSSLFSEAASPGLLRPYLTVAPLTPTPILAQPPSTPVLSRAWVAAQVESMASQATTDNN